MAEGEDGKTEKPTGKKVGEARSEGMVARSADLSSAILLFIGALLLSLFADWLHSHLSGLMVSSFEAISRYDQLPGNLPRLGIQGYWFLLKLLMPFLLVLTAVSVAVNLAQYGPLLAGEATRFNFARIFSPTNFLKFFSMAALMGMPKNFAKMAAVSLVAWAVVSGHYPEYLALADQSPRQIAGFMFDVSRELILKCAALLLGLGILDLFWSRRQYQKKLMMSKQEVKDEMKASEGDPRIKGKIKSLRRQMYGKMLAHELPKATVVITNPTFIAIALRYEPGKDRAPVVLSKGKRLMAERIRDAAREHGIPIVEDKPVARGLFETAEVGEEIPAEFFAAVAEILAAVLSLKGAEKVGIPA